MREREPAPSAPAAEELRDGSEQAEDLPPVDEATALRGALEALQRQHEEVVQERQGLHDRYLRLAAEFDNFRKRNAREWQEQRQRAAAEVLRSVLEIADNLERALQAPAEDAQGLRGGVELIRQQLQASLQRFGIACIEAKGLPFDPARHEAVLLVESEGVESQHVVDVVQQGYTLHGEVLRPARVTVSR